ncbi:MAG TPA: glycerol-3-phosphate transporter [Flavobacteriales bacterium]|nr:glycerol-3-phosphate transporter [Flavobacteriales bacterium]HIN40232.1 glycerol-3-phosphate transporter [Flavobacteriales bacterium]
MLRFLQNPPEKPLLPKEQIDKTYTRLRLQVFMGIFVGYAGYYLVRKNFALAMPDLIAQGFTKGQLGLAFSFLAIAYGLSKLLMGNVSDRSNARYFMPLGLLLSALVMIAMGWIPFATSAVWIMGVLLFLNGWFQGMGWPPSGRTMVHWFSIKERGTKMAIWNVAHNIGGGLMAPLAILGVELFVDWHAKFYFPGVVALAVAGLIFLLLRATPQSEGLPSVEEWKNDYPEDYDASMEKQYGAREIFTKYIFPNRLLWTIALANAFVYLVRYGISDWAPVYLQEAKGFDFKASGWAYSLYEFAGIPGTLLCGWLSDSVFKGKRAPVSILYMLIVAAAIIVYWQNPAGKPMIDSICLITIGFFIYGPVMLIGVHALDLVPKNAAGTSAGLTGLFGYFLGTALLANVAAGYIIDAYSWNGFFLFMLGACALSILLLAITWKKE